MNLLSPHRTVLAVDVVFDLVCPWCFIGTRRLARTLRARPDVLVSIGWRPFLLNPEAGQSGRAELPPRRPAGEDRSRRLHATLTEMGKAEGLPFRFDLIRRVPNSLDAHRMVRFAARHGRSEEVVDALFLAHFSRGLDIADPAILLAVGVTEGLDRTMLREFLATTAEAETVHAENLRAHRLGINGVPCFVFADGHAIAGAQEPEVLERLIDVAIATA